MNHFSDNLYGWFNFHELYEKVVREAGENAHFVEIGSFLGQSSSFMCVEIINSSKNIKFDCVDSWEDVWLNPSLFEYCNYQGNKEDYTQKDFFYNFSLKNMEPVKDYFDPIRKTSLEASNLYTNNQLDFVFIDSNYDNETLTEQIGAWWPKIKIGGILGVHDYEIRDMRKQVYECFDEKLHTVFIGAKTNPHPEMQYKTCYITKQSEDQLKNIPK